MRLLVASLLVLTALSGLGVVLSREPRRMVMALSANGVVLACLFMALQAPDVAFSELTVGAAATPLLFLVVLARMRLDAKPGGNQEPGPPTAPGPPA